MVAPNNPYSVLLAHGSVSVTGSKTVKVPGPGKIAAVSVVQEASLAADVNKAAKLSVKIASDKKSFTVYAWKSKAAGDTELVAATDAVTVNWLVVRGS